MRAKSSKQRCPSLCSKKTHSKAQIKFINTEEAVPAKINSPN